MPGWWTALLWSPDPCAELAAAMCPDGTGAACVVDGPWAVPLDGCALDLAGIDVTFTGNAVLDLAGHETTLLAGSLTLEPGAWVLDTALAGAGFTAEVEGEALLGGSVEVGSPARGGRIAVSAGGSLTLTGELLAPGTGSGGEVALTSEGPMSIEGRVDLRGYGYGEANAASLSLVSAGDLTVAPGAELDGEGGYYYGGAVVTLASTEGDLRLQGLLEASSWTLTGPVSLSGCAVEVTGAANLVNASVELVAREQMTLSGAVHVGEYGGDLTLRYRDSAPIVTGAVDPAPTLVQDATLTPCGVAPETGETGAPQDTGAPPDTDAPQDTGTPDTATPSPQEPAAEGQPDAKSGGCGCDGGGGSAGWGLLLAIGLPHARRKGAPSSSAPSRPRSSLRKNRTTPPSAT
jgi:hypothetical protein